MKLQLLQLLVLNNKNVETSLPLDVIYMRIQMTIVKATFKGISRVALTYIKPHT